MPVHDFQDHTPYIGLDWFILDLLGSTLIFVLIEKLFPLYKGQTVFRKEWQTDMAHFVMNHFIVGLIFWAHLFSISQLAVPLIFFPTQTVHHSNFALLHYIVFSLPG